MDMKNFNIYLGAYASWIEAKPARGTNMKMPVTVGVCVLNTFSDTIKAHFMQALSLLN
jgi:hypothetical protein